MTLAVLISAIDLCDRGFDLRRIGIAMERGDEGGEVLPVIFRQLTR